MPLIIPNLPVSQPRSKTTSEERKAIFAINLHLKVPKPILAEAFNLSIAAIHQICSLNDHYYKDVKLCMHEHGVDYMFANYVTQDMLDKLATLSANRKPLPQNRLQPKQGSRSTPNYNADRFAGEHSVEGFNGSPVPLDIRWFGYGERASGAGWYVARLDREDPPRYMLGDDKPFPTSTDAFDWAREQVWI